MNNPFNAAALATVTSTLAGLLIVLSQGWHGKHTGDHDLASVQKFHTAPVPRIGGLAVFCAIGATLLMAAVLADLILPQYVYSAALLLAAGLPTFGAGVIEDLTKKVSVRARLAASFASALLASWLLGATVARLDIWGVDLLLAWQPIAYAVTAVTVAGGVNAINIIDGFNGLAASISVVMLAALGCVAYQIGDVMVLELALLGLGATAGFLIVNYPTGRLFLGDGGAYLIGFWVAELVVLLLVRNPEVSAWQLLSICAYPVIEVMYSIYRRKFVRKASPGDPDGLHLHTLIYRRVVPRFVRPDAHKPWKRNAAVAFIISPAVASAAVLTVAIGQAALVSMLIVILQILAYVAVYGRVVRGRWFARASATVRAGEELRTMGLKAD